MDDRTIEFKEKMFVFAAESAENPQKLKVTIPDLFLDKKSGGASSQKVSKGSTNIYVNAYPPAVTNTAGSNNYIVLPVIKYFTGPAYVHGHVGTAEVGIGKVKVGDRLLAEFIGCSPDNGVIIGRC